jgi:gluconate kinase
MKAGMLGSQLAALEWPDDAIVVDVSRSLDEVCADVIHYVRGALK